MLTGKQKRELRGMANGLKAVVIIGKEGINENVADSCDVALEAQELVKVSILKTCSLNVKEVAIELAVLTKSEVVQTIGRTAVLYRKSRNPKLVI